jgi:hypothetical protein
MIRLRKILCKPRQSLSDFDAVLARLNDPTDRVERALRERLKKKLVSTTLRDASWSIN